MMTFKEWWNEGRNERIPNENQSSWKTLILDDFSQITLSDSAFKENKTGIQNWRPFKAFTPEMFRTGPIPLIRQIVERPFKFFN